MSTTTLARKRPYTPGPGTIAARLLAMSEREGGIRPSDAAREFGMDDIDNVYSAITRLHKHGLIVKHKLSPKHTVYTRTGSSGITGSPGTAYDAPVRIMSSDSPARLSADSPADFSRAKVTPCPGFSGDRWRAEETAQPIFSRVKYGSR